MTHKIRFLAALGLPMLMVILIMGGLSCAKALTEAELEASVELVDVDTRWEKKYYQPWPPKLILVPAISFKIKNVGEIPLEYVYCNGIFKFVDENENLGDNFVAGIRGEPVLPGELSDTIVLQSFQGVEGANLAHFKNNPAWKTVAVKVFVRSKGSQYVLVGEYDVSKRINFKEPEAPKPKEKKDAEKK